MRLAVIDIGTNSVRLDVYQLEGEPRLLHREKTMVRLGQGLFETGALNADAIKRTLAALTTFKHWSDDLNVDRVVAYATSALRSAADREEFVNLVSEECGFRVDIISGKEEARLILTGVLQDRRTRYGSFAFVDIGGGSTEIGMCSLHEVKFLESYDLGAARLTQTCLQDRSIEEGISCMREIIRSELTSRPPLVDPSISCILGSSGTVKAVKKLLAENFDCKHIKHSKLRKLISKMASLSPSEVIELPGMNPRRADIILAGSVLLAEVMEVFEFPEIRFTPFAMRDGILRQQLETIEFNPSNEVGLSAFN